MSDSILIGDTLLFIILLYSWQVSYTKSKPTSRSSRTLTRFNRMKASFMSNQSTNRLRSQQTSLIFSSNCLPSRFHSQTQLCQSKIRESQILERATMPRPVLLTHSDQGSRFDKEEILPLIKTLVDWQSLQRRNLQVMRLQKTANSTNHLRLHSAQSSNRSRPHRQPRPLRTHNR